MDISTSNLPTDKFVGSDGFSYGLYMSVSFLQITYEQITNGFFIVGNLSVILFYLWILSTSNDDFSCSLL